MKILQSQTILESDGKHGDAIRGPGTYVTKYGPSISQDEVAKNNFDGSAKYWESKKQDGKTQAIFQMQLPKDKVQDFSSELNRNVHVHRGNINLKEAKDVKLHMRTGDKYCQTLKPI